MEKRCLKIYQSSSKLQTSVWKIMFFIRNKFLMEEKIYTKIVESLLWLSDGIADWIWDNVGSM